MARKSIEAPESGPTATEDTAPDLAVGALDDDSDRLIDETVAILLTDGAKLLAG